MDVIEHKEAAMYPRTESDVTVIGPQCFASEDRSVLCWQGVNYVPQDTYQGAVMPRPLGTR